MHFGSGCSHPSSAFPWRSLLPHLLALLLLHLGSAQLTVVAPSLPVTANVGQDVVLRCHLCPCKDAWSSDIRWIQHRSGGFVHHYQNGVDLEQMEEYKGRTELLRNGLSDGNLELRITAVSSSDSGLYSCAVQDFDGYAEAVVKLEVSDPFSPITHSWAAALAVVVTLLLGSFVIIVFLHRKQVAQSRELTELTARLGLSAADLMKQVAKLVEQTEAVEKCNSALKKHHENTGLNAADLKKLAAKLRIHCIWMGRWDAKLETLSAKLVDQTEALEERTKILGEDIEELEKGNTTLKERCEKMDISVAKLKILSAKLKKQTEELEKGNSLLKIRHKNRERRDAKLEEKVAEPVEQTEDEKKENLLLDKHYEEMGFAADLKEKVAEQMEQTEELEETSAE